MYPSNRPQSVEPTISITSPGWIAKCPLTLDSYFSMHTTVVLGCPIEQVADSELVPTPDESLIISLVSPRLLSVPNKKRSIIKSHNKRNLRRRECGEFPWFVIDVIWRRDLSSSKEIKVKKIRENKNFKMGLKSFSREISKTKNKKMSCGEKTIENVLETSRKEFN